MADLFGEIDAPAKTKVTQRTTSFGEKIDVLARREGGWPDTYIVYALEVIAPKQILMEGDAPIGWHRDGWPKFAPRKVAKPMRVVVSEAAYREACSDKDVAP